MNHQNKLQNFLYFFPVLDSSYIMGGWYAITNSSQSYSLGMLIHVTLCWQYTNY